MMQSLLDDPMFLNSLIVVIGVVFSFIETQVVDETIESIENEGPGTFARKMELLFREKKNTWHLLWLGIFAIGWSLVVIGVYGFGQLLLLRYPNLVIESIIPLVFAISLGPLIIRSNVRHISKITTEAGLDEEP